MSGNRAFSCCAVLSRRSKIATRTSSRKKRARSSLSKEWSLWERTWIWSSELLFASSLLLRLWAFEAIRSHSLSSSWRSNTGTQSGLLLKKNEWVRLWWRFSIGDTWFPKTCSRVELSLRSNEAHHGYSFREERHSKLTQRNRETYRRLGSVFALQSGL